ncbi:MAG: hypothetical protein HOD63_09430 [Bacteroidetes bacterium]|nr:hypothetical protein [Bacteroidota bacterium]MBT5531379.1 hypothetical protein [Cytophagia bacterium]MBT3424071.1 hypothetical protein [Bacteroidota bacterium]MBT3934478.1 hypothetical protein [Bacteroidota bacterium]MBT4338800.1 hypothetical protein [Bacteroidota bacterium]
MKKIIILLVAISFSYIAKSQNTEISGFVRNYTGVLLETGDFSILQNTLDLNFEKTGGKAAFKANPMLYHYDNNKLDLRLRELYMDLYFDNFDLRIGQQQIVWGKADGAFITDIVSPLNLTEFLLPDFDEIRTGVLATKLDYYIGNHTFEVIWMPLFTPTEIPQAGSIWHVQPEFPIVPTFDWSKSSMTPNLENSELFVKYSAMTSKIDFELMGGYTWDDNPSMHIEKIIDMSTGKPVLTGLNITPEHHRLLIGGGSFSSEIKGVVLRGEAAYYNGKYFQTEDPFANDALVQKDYIHYLTGVDFSIKGVKFSSQFIQEVVLDYDEKMQKTEIENTMTFLARYDLLRETLHLELFSYIGLTNQDALIRPKITYDFDDGFSILLGSNIFVGDDKGRFGQYADNSMIYTKIKYSF